MSRIPKFDLNMTSEKKGRKKSAIGIHRILSFPTLQVGVVRFFSFHVLLPSFFLIIINIINIIIINIILTTSSSSTSSTSSSASPSSDRMTTTTTHTDLFHYWRRRNPPVSRRDVDFHSGFLSKVNFLVVFLMGEKFATEKIRV